MAYHIVPQTQGILEEAMLEGHNGYACFTIKKRPVLRTIQGDRWIFRGKGVRRIHIKEGTLVFNVPGLILTYYSIEIVRIA